MSSAAEESVIKLNELKQIVSKIEQGKSGTRKLDPADFVSSLFRRAPSRFLKNTSLERLANIAEVSFQHYLTFTQSAQAFTVETFPLQSGSGKNLQAIRTFIKDRPFIVDSLSVLLNRLQLKELVKLHPILTTPEGTQVSHVYLEVESNSEIPDLKQEITNIFQALISVTDDFASMQAEAKKVSEQVAKNQYQGVTELEKTESSEFITWLINPGFVFIGFSIFSKNAENTLGLLRDTNSISSKLIKEISVDLRTIPASHLVSHSKLTIKSPVHRGSYLDCIIIRLTEDKFAVLVGLLTSRGLTEDTSKVPLIRQRLNELLDSEGLKPNSHNYKELTDFADSLPKFDFLELSNDELKKDFSQVFELQKSGQQKLRTFSDRLKRFTCLRLLLPKERISSENNNLIRKQLETLFKLTNNSCEVFSFKSNAQLGAISFLLPTIIADSSAKELEKSIASLSRTWEEQLLEDLGAGVGEEQAEKLHELFAFSFPDQYKSTTSAADAVFDINYLSKLNGENKFEVALKTLDVAGFKKTRFMIYKLGESISLSELLPFLDNIGFSIERELATSVRSNDVYTIYDFSVRPTQANNTIDSNFSESVSKNLKLILTSAAANDPLNTLILTTGLSCQDVAVIRTAVQYLWQIKAISSKETLVNALNLNPFAAQTITNYFRAKFDPSLFSENKIRAAKLEEIKADFAEFLKGIKNLAHDRALRALLNVFEACVRTNFYQHPDEIRIALKIRCANINSMPSPRPLFETFVSAAEFEGVHLRGGMVARGGLRWSDRVDDFRTEVLGLMKTQVVKNSIIVPTGAKGGFVLKNRPTENTALRAKVEQCYKGFITCLLELGDNLIDGKIVHPPATVRHDDDDSYLVVAADRGTATFSDLANGIAQKNFNFWLQDAFASGGSNGYDHKKYGITARGAWETTCRHFREIGLDVDSQEFTCVGIGDMSGDVFGNGMLLSKNLKLIAAFDHRHIFIDPNPDAKTSFTERTRLFAVPFSSWADYNASLISKGGGVFERSLKEIIVSSETATALGCEAGAYSGEDLMKIILKAPVDLLWNGGIGTYVKSSEESNSQVGDPANDDLRVDGKDLRTRVIGEGGNLGLTQRGRIEYARIGGRLNTDAVDNSGGVDLSDHEVNLKILLSIPLKSGKLNYQDRNTLLEQCAHEICDKVISHNRSQSRLLSLAVKRSRKYLRYYRTLINRLESEGLLKRAEEFLPDDEALAKRGDLKAGLTRPELAVLTAYAKISVYNTLIASKIPEDPFVEKFLVDYFPKSVSIKYATEVTQHPLRKEIIATRISNLLIERMGSSFIVRICDEMGVSRESAITAFLAVDEIMQLDQVGLDLEVTDRANTTRAYIEFLNGLQESTEAVIRWILTSHPQESLTNIVKLYRDGIANLLEKTPSFLPDIEMPKFQESYEKLLASGTNKKTATVISASQNAASYMDILNISQKHKKDPLKVAALYMTLSANLQVRQIMDQALTLDSTDRWEISAISTMIIELKNSIAGLTHSVCNCPGKDENEQINSYFKEKSSLLTAYRESLYELQKHKLSVPALFVVTRQLQALSKSQN